MCAKPVASIIIPTYERSRFLQDAIVSLRMQTCPGDFEIIVVDNAPSERLRESVAALAGQPGPQVRYVAEPRPGLHQARHTGAQAALADILVYVDDDIFAQAGWLTTLLTPYETPRVACVGGKVLPYWEVEPPEWLAYFSPSYHSLLDYGDVQRELSTAEYINGCNFSVRKQTLFEVGGFNPDGFRDRRLIWYRGDGEYGLLRKVRAAGYKVVYAPGAVIEHRIPAERLTPEYMRHRAFNTGIEAVYTYYRYQRPSWGGLGLRAFKFALKIVRDRWRQMRAEALGRSIQALKESVVVASSQGQVLHTIRLLCQPEMRHHCLRETYFD